MSSCKKTVMQTDKRAFVIMENPYGSGWRSVAVCLDEELAKKIAVELETKYFKYQIHDIKLICKTKKSWWKNFLLLFTFNKTLLKSKKEILLK